MAVLIAFLLYRSFTIYSFFKAYVVDYSSALSEMSPRSLLTFYTFLMLLVVIIIIIILFSVMIYKKKPKLLYIYSLIVYILIIILCAITSPILRDITVTNLDVRVSSALRDFFLMAVITQAICLVLYIVRATGFDIKRFDFVTDLQQLDIDDKDSEEIEVSLEFDSNQTRRQIRYKFRQLKYIYGENKFIMNTLGIIAVVVIAFLVYFNIGIYTASYDEGTSFTASGVVMNVRSTYLTQNGPTGSALTSSMFVVVKVDLKTAGSSDQTLNTGLVTLNIGDESYGQDSNYAKELYDLGTAYSGQTLSEEFKSYILVFLISEEDADKDMILKFNDNVSYVNGELGAKNILITLNPISLDGDQEEMESTNLGETETFDDGVLEGVTLTINSYEVADKFKLSYTYCYGTDKCLDSTEYLTPTATGNYIKSLMKIDVDFSVDQNLNDSQISTFRSFLNTFATISYRVGQTWTTESFSTQAITPTVATDTENYYIEVPRAIEEADEIYLSFKIRNNIYKYILK